MPYVPPNVLVAGPVEADKFDENLTALRAYLQNQITAADIDVAWVELTHIKLPEYSGVIGRTLLTGGVVQGLTYVPGDAATAFSYSLATADDQIHDVGQTGLDIHLDHNVIMTLEYGGFIAYCSDGWSGYSGGRLGTAWLEIDGVKYYPNMPLVFSDVNNYKTRIKLNHAHATQTLAAGDHKVKVVAKSEFGVAFQFAWYIQMQAFYF